MEQVALRAVGAFRRWGRTAARTCRWSARCTWPPATWSRRCSAARSSTAPTRRRRSVPPNLDRLEIVARGGLCQPGLSSGASGSVDALREKHGGLLGDVNWGGVLNMALDLRGQTLFLDMLDRPDELAALPRPGSPTVIERFTQTWSRGHRHDLDQRNRNVRHIAEPVFLHSECSQRDDLGGRLRAVPHGLRRRLEPAVPALRHPLLRQGPAPLRRRRSPGCRTSIFSTWAGAATWPSSAGTCPTRS